MSLANKLGSQFERRLQERGRHIVNTDAVRVTEQSANHIYATVQGTQEYQVRVTYERDARNRDNLVVSCTCAYFADFSRCKHIWAVILEAGRRHALLSAEYARFLRIDRETPDGGEPRVQPPRVVQMPRPQSQRVPPWQEYLRQIQESVQAQ